MYEIFKDLIDERGLKPADVAKGAGIPPSTFTDWKKGRSVPKDDKLQKIANFLGVTKEYLKGSDDYEEICPICQKRYSPNNAFQIKEHEIYHKQFLEASQKYGKPLFFKEREALKKESYSIINDDSASIEELKKAYVDLYKAFFYRSLEYAKFNTQHPTFNKYISMILNQAFFTDKMSAPVKYMLIEEYGVSDGLPEGETDFDVTSEKIVKLTPKDDRDIKKDLDSLMDKLRNREYGPAAYDGEEIPEDDLDLFAGQVELMLRRLKTINKEKYNPHKNKK